MSPELKICFISESFIAVNLPAAPLFRSLVRRRGLDCIAPLNQIKRINHNRRNDPTMKPIYAGVLSPVRRCALALGLCAMVCFNLFGSPADLPPGFPEVALKSKMRGEAAINGLGNKLAPIAAAYRM